MDSGKRGKNPVAMTIINPRKEYWPSQGSNQRPHVLKSATLPTELWGLALDKVTSIQNILIRTVMVNPFPNDRFETLPN